MSLLYVTSFSEDLYKATGHRLLKSYINLKMNEDLLVCYENFEYKPPEKSKIIAYPLHESEYLKKWLHDNRDIIPDYLGGLATKTDHPKIFSELMKRKASRFFRKVAALEYALRTYGDKYEYIVWLDCDGYFVKNMAAGKVVGLFKDAGVIYHLGAARKKNNTGIETGWIGFAKSASGYKLLEEVIEYYKGTEFRALHRWDDGYVFRYHVDKTTTVKCVDLAPNCKYSHPIKFCSPIKAFFRHDKGYHFKKKVST